MTENHTATPWPSRLLVGGGIVLLLLVGAGYTWTFTPSYSLYRIKYALEAHDYTTFSAYVDLDSVLDHAFDEFAGDVEERAAGSVPSGPLARALRKGFLKRFAREAREITKAGASIAVEQAIKDPDRQLPEIPTVAVVGALWHGSTNGDMVSFPVKAKKGGQVEVKMRQNAEGVWQVIEVSNLPALFPALRSRTSPDRSGQK